MKNSDFISLELAIAIETWYNNGCNSNQKGGD